MSDTARLALTVVCWVLALVAELSAIALLAREGRAAGRVLRRWYDAPRPGDERQRPSLDAALQQLLVNRFDRGAAVFLLVLGVVVGTVGNLLSL
jgi:hypothetical protein